MKRHVRLPRLSLKAQLYVWLLVPMLALMVASSWMAYGSALAMAHSVFDRMLLGSSRMIGESFSSDEGLRAELPPAALENLQTGANDLVYYRVDAPQEGLLAGASGFPRYNGSLAPEEWRSFDAQFHGEAVRAVAFAQPVYPFSTGSTVIIQVATTMRGQSALLWRIWLRSVWPQALLLVAVAALGWTWVRMALAPFVRERERFISNAAHQLKTPMTVLNTQIAVGLRSPDSEHKQRALLGCYQTVQHCTRLIHQLLTLSSTEHPLRPAPRASAVDLTEVSREVLVDLAEMAHRKNIDLGLDAPDGVPRVQGAALLLRELIANLVDNAIRYTPEGGTVTIRLAHQGSRVRLEVEDNGPGIPERERERVFERFYRLPDTAGQDGSGLGLAIVREIALTCGAHVQLLDRIDAACGLLARVTLAALPG